MSTIRILIALTLLISGAVFAVQMSGQPAQIATLFIFGIFTAGVILYRDPEPAVPHSAVLERQKKQILLKGRLAAYQDIIDPLADPILLVRDAKVAFANPAANKVLGDHIVGEDVRIAIRHPAAADRLANPDAKHTGEPTLLVGVGSAEQRWELRIRALDDGLKLVHLSDQSSRYAADRMRTDFVANASHELRTPLAAIRGFIETLQDPKAGNDGDTRARFLKIMFDEADRMHRLVDDLMSLSRIEAERYQLPDEPVDLSGLITETQSFFLTSRGKKKRDFIVSLPDNMPLVNGDRGQLAQLLHNLVGNAIKYGGKNSPISIDLTPNRSGSMLKLKVADKGSGIPQKHLPRLTERFYRVDKGRSKSIGGTGLGLAIVKHITERHGGRLDISSEEGVGTTVSVSLPVRQPEDSAT
ncbi:Phosphate regulon sensor protein PhoR (SphS) [hydrothermal vent metagenome]|uniref:histidine kinase n=1 Tax=hydrothermal vent metagenome TaxID=652676 RepID=A0A3B0SBN4_9ZZZZ